MVSVLTHNVNVLTITVASAVTLSVNLLTVAFATFSVNLLKIKIAISKLSVHLFDNNGCSCHA